MTKIYKLFSIAITDSRNSSSKRYNYHRWNIIKISGYHKVSYNLENIDPVKNSYEIKYAYENKNYLN